MKKFLIAGVAAASLFSANAASAGDVYNWSISGGVGPPTGGGDSKKGGHGH